MFKSVIILGYAIIVFAILLVVGSVVVDKVSNNVGGVANTTGQYMLTQLGSTSGLASWTPAIIAVGIGFLFLGYFGFGGKQKGY